MEDSNSEFILLQINLIRFVCVFLITSHSFGLVIFFFLQISIIKYFQKDHVTGVTAAKV